PTSRPQHPTLSLHDALPISRPAHDRRSPDRTIPPRCEHCDSGNECVCVLRLDRVLYFRFRVGSQLSGEYVKLLLNLGHTFHLNVDRKSTRLNSSHQISSYAV